MYKQVVFIAFSGLLLFLASCKTGDFDAKINRIKPSEADTLVLSGLVSNEPGQHAGNSVFVDMSKDVQTSFPRSNWDLGFYSGPEFRVILNHSLGATAIQTNSNDITQVSAADTIPLAAGMTLALGNSQTTVDPVTGSFQSYLEGTVFKDISAVPSDNKVFIVNSGLPLVLQTGSWARSWQKVRVLRSAAGYSVQYYPTRVPEGPDVPTIRPVEIRKDPAYNFQYISFTRGRVSVEPPKTLWDFEWTYTTYKDEENKPAGTPDFVLINFAAGVEAAEVMEIGEDLTFENFTESNLGGVTFSAERDAIGTKWRRLIGEGNAGSSVYRDRFYLIKDMQNNIYKLRFMNFIAGDGGPRGQPRLEYKLVKDGLSENP